MLCNNGVVYVYMLESIFLYLSKFVSKYQNLFISEGVYIYTIYMCFCICCFPADTLIVSMYIVFVSVSTYADLHLISIYISIRI